MSSIAPFPVVICGQLLKPDLANKSLSDSMGRFEPASTSKQNETIAKLGVSRIHPSADFSFMWRLRPTAVNDASECINRLDYDGVLLPGRPDVMVQERYSCLFECRYVFDTETGGYDSVPPETMQLSGGFLNESYLACYRIEFSLPYIIATSEIKQLSPSKVCYFFWKTCFT